MDFIGFLNFDGVYGILMVLLEFKHQCLCLLRAIIDK